MYQKDHAYALKGRMYFIRSWINQELEHWFQLAVKALVNVFALCFKFEPKPKSSKKPKSLDTLKLKKW